MCPDDPVLSSYLDHQLSARGSARVEAHLHDCDDCRIRLRRYQSVAHRLLECDEPDVEQAGARVRERIAARLPVAAAPRRRSLRLPIAAASMAAALAVAFTAALGERPAALDRQPGELGLWGQLREWSGLGEWGRLPERSATPAPGAPAAPPAGADGSAVLELSLPADGRFQLFSPPAILHEVEVQPLAAAALGDPVTMKVQLPPARYRLVGTPVIVHEAELEQPGP